MELKGNFLSYWSYFQSIMLKERLKSCGALWKVELGDVPRKSRVYPYYGVWKDPKICTSLAMESHLGLVKARLSGFSVLGQLNQNIGY